MVRACLSVEQTRIIAKNEFYFSVCKSTVFLPTGLGPFITIRQEWYDAQVIPADALRPFLGTTLDKTDFGGFGKKYEGKVRDVYALNAHERLLGEAPLGRGSADSGR